MQMNVSQHVHLPHAAIYKQQTDKAFWFLWLLGNPQDQHIDAGNEWDEKQQTIGSSLTR